ncbi:MAG: hypothetical protein HUJ63_12700 [Enterococcus sp.]|nr:hypothetical protein [Enterococcus sp.]
MAEKKGICNKPNEFARGNMIALIDNVLDPLRDLYGAPVRVNSGYRCPELNLAVAGARNSQHLTGEAADLTTGSAAGNKRLFELAKRLNFDQLIDEYGFAWVHISFSRNHKNRKEVLKIK